jgi:hypothetical protein
VNGTINGTAVTQSDTDTTAGRLLKVGDFGVGGDIATNVVDLDALVVSGKYVVTQGSPNTPTPNEFFYVDVTSHIANVWVKQVASTLGTNVTGVKTFERYLRNGTWQPWVEIYHTGNILGTVSQSGGVPTGAIIERGSNSNGEWVRYADGTQICWVNSFTPTTYWGAGADWLSPAIFSSTPTVTVSPKYIVSGGTDAVYCAESLTNNNNSYKLKCLVVSNGGEIYDSGATVQATAIGRWY